MLSKITMHAYLIITFIGVILTFIGIRALNRYHVVRNWARTDGVLIDLHRGYAEERIKYSSLKYEYPVAEYEYYSQDKKYVGTKISIESKNAWVPVSEASRSPWSQWKKGEKVAVFFDPRNPAHSVLIPDLQPRRRSHILALTLSGLLLLFGSIGIATLSA
ncbi:MAG: DUF3592 domain-containing protein [Thiobacillus sp.]